MSTLLSSDDNVRGDTSAVVCVVCRCLCLHKQPLYINLKNTTRMSVETLTTAKEIQQPQNLSSSVACEDTDNERKIPPLGARGLCKPNVYYLQPFLHLIRLGFE